MITDTSDLHQIVYLSSATRELTETELLELLKGSRERNRKRGITGIMLYADGNIIHVIEGPTATVTDLFEKIKKDPRHQGQHLLWSKALAKRDFPDYSMGFRRETTSGIEEEVPGFSDVVDSHYIPQELLDRVSRHVAVFLRTFAKSTRIVN